MKMSHASKAKCVDDQWELPEDLAVANVHGVDRVSKPCLALVSHVHMLSEVKRVTAGHNA